MINQPSRHCTVTLQAAPARFGQVRRIVSAQLRYWRLDPLVDPAALGVTELLANVHRHARPSKQATVELSVLLDQLTVSVHDLDPREPRLRGAGPEDTDGRGLALVAALSESWGVRPRGEGKTVWFALPALTPAHREAGMTAGATDPRPPLDRLIEEVAGAGAPTGGAGVG